MRMGALFINTVAMFFVSVNAGYASSDLCVGYGATAFACTIEKNNKAVSVCVNDKKMMRYRYGPASGTADIELYASTVNGFDGFFNHGVGRYIWHEATFENAGYSYIVGFSADRLDENHPISGYVQVLNGSESVASLACSENSIFNAMDLLY